MHRIFEISLPLQNPVLIFSLILFIILFAPILLNKFRIPHLIGLIIAGALIGPNAFHLLPRDSSIILFGTVGLLYIMFLAGVEIDLAEFKKNSWRSLVFGLYTFLIPMGLGITAGLYLLEFPLPTSILLASMFASHTLIAYPLISKLGVHKDKAVNITIGGTMITDTLALLVLAVIVGMSTGNGDTAYWIRLGISVVVFGLLVMIGFPILGRWFFKRYDDNVSQYIFVLGLVFLAAFLAEAAGIEAIIGAFLGGLALNRLIPRTSPLMNRVEFVGNALFIPFFLIGVGMLIDYRAFFKDFETIKVAAVMTIVATSAKFIAAWFTQVSFRFTADQRRLIFGLSNAQAAATLAAVLVGYNIIINRADIDAGAAFGVIVEPVRLLNDSVLNGTIVMILVTCTIASLVAQRGAQNIALAATTGTDAKEGSSPERILISTDNPNTVDELVNLCVTVKSPKNKRGLYALSVVDNEKADVAEDKLARKILDKAAVTAAATDNHLFEILRYDLNIVNGIASVVKEHQITDLILELHERQDPSASFLGINTEGLLARCNTTTLIYRPAQPLATVKRYLIIVPARAEREIGFPFWLIKVWNLSRNTGAKLVFYAPEQTLTYIRQVHQKHPVPCDFNVFGEWDDFLILSRDVRLDDCLCIVMSRRDRLSYMPMMARIPVYLDRYFAANNFILVYPMQSGVAGDDMDLKNPSVLEPLKELDDIGKTIVKLFRKKQT